MSSIDLKLINAYQNAYYQVWHDEGIFELKIGVKSRALCELFLRTKTETSIFITAFNPLGVMHSEIENKLFQTKLRYDLEAISNIIYDGEGGDLSGEWPAEHSYLVMGIDRSTGIKIGNKYEQNAILWVGSDHVPELILLR